MREDVHKRLAARSDNAPRGSPECLVRHEQHRTLSLVLPARPETAAVAHLAAAVRAGPLDTVPRIDDLLLIGFHSTDRTAATAAPAGPAAGLGVFRQGAILRAYGNIPGTRALSDTVPVGRVALARPAPGGPAAWPTTTGSLAPWADRRASARRRAGRPPSSGRRPAWRGSTWTCTPQLLKENPL